MAQTDLAEYKRQLEADPSAKNDGTWYARTTVRHDELTFKEGAKLPELTNGQVAQLLDVNALTSVAPAAGNSKASSKQAAAAAPTENEFDANGNPVNAQ